MNYQIIGGVVEKGKRKGIGRVRVEAWDSGGNLDDYISYALTDDDSTFIITMSEEMIRDLFPRQALDVYFKVWCDRQLIVSTEGITHWNTDRPTQRVRIEAPKPKPIVWSEKHVYLKIERMEGYSPVKPLEEEAAQAEYERDCMRNKGHENGKIPQSEIDARAVDAVVYREYLDSAYIVPKTDRLIAADVNEPLYENRVPGPVIYAHAHQRLKIHVWNDDEVPHSLHAHGLQYGIDSDGTWPFGTQAGSNGPRSDAICPGKTWTYTFDISYDQLGAWPFHDYTHYSNISVEQGLFGGIVVLDYCDKPPRPFRFRRGMLKKIYDDLAQSEGRAFFAKDANLDFDEECAPFILERGIHVKRFNEETLTLLEHHLHFLEEFTSRQFAISTKHIPTDHVPLFFHRLVRKEEPPPPQPPQRPPILDLDLVVNRQRQLFELAADVVRRPFDLVLNPEILPLPPFPRPAPIPSLCINGRTFVGNTPTIEARAGQRIRWYVFNLDISSSAHNFHAHGMRWSFAGEIIDTRSFGPGESFIVEATVPPVLLLTEEEARCQQLKHRPKDAELFVIKGDFLFHCHEHEHLLGGMAGLVRSWQSLWLTPVMADAIRRRTGLPIEDFLNECPDVEPNPCGPESIGRWEPIAGAPETLLMHSILLPNTKRVLFWGQTRSDQTHVWDYSTPAGSYMLPFNQPASLPGLNDDLSDLWSGGHTILNDAPGTVLAHGGFTGPGIIAAVGNVRAFLFDPPTLTWSQTNSTTDSRFYPTTLTIGDGRAVTLFGSASKSFEVFTAGAGWAPPIPVPASMFHHEYYPWTYLLPSGLLFIAGPHTPSQRFDFNAPAGVETFATGKGDRSSGSEKGSSVMLILRPPDYKPIVYRMGGDFPGTEKSVEQIDLSVPSPTWVDLPDLKNARADQFTATLMPDGRVFIAGGIRGGPDGGPCEIFDPRAATPEWIEGPNMQFERTYHSSFILLMDGSILGGGAPPNAQFPPFTAHERFFPGYFESLRPVISGAPPAINYAGSFTINTPTPLDIGEVVLLRPGAVTHGFNMSQRGIELVITGTGAGSITVQTPPSANHLPPGWHLLFILDFDRVPSEGRWIRLTP